MSVYPRVFIMVIIGLLVLTMSAMHVLAQESDAAGETQTTIFLPLVRQSEDAHGGVQETAKPEGDGMIPEPRVFNRFKVTLDDGNMFLTCVEEDAEQ